MSAAIDTGAAVDAPAEPEPEPELEAAFTGEPAAAESPASGEA